MPLYGTGWPLLAPDGTATAPSYSFGSSTGTGLYLSSPSPAIAIGGTLRYTFGAGILTLASTSAQISFNSDTVFIRDGAANTLALRNSTNAQTFRVYNTYTDSSNYERGFARWTTNVFEIGAEGAGTGSQRGTAIDGATLSFRVAGTNRWIVSASGHLLANADNTYDIGASGATRPRTIYIGTDGIFGGSLNAIGAISIRSTTSIPAGGTAGAGYKLSSTSNFGVFFGSGAPTLAAAKGSLYLRSDGSGVADRMYVNTDGSTTWTAVATVA